jgi:antitoxin component YwqK of YwqJK toxin-antitoxin module
MHRYYDDGTIKAVINFKANSNRSYAKMYYNNGVLAGEGNFIESQKDSVWRYYSFYDKCLKMEETYVDGVKTGVTKKYYTNQQVAEELNYTNNMKNGSWKQYFNTGAIKLEATFDSDKRTGSFLSYYPDGHVETKGWFVNNQMEGPWTYYDEEGKEKMTVKYKAGTVLNPEVIDKKNEELFKILDSNKGKIPEPDENSLMPRQ